MSLLFLLVAQATSSAPPERIGLTVPAPCHARRSPTDEIVVCARRPDGSSPYRINQPPPPQPELPKAEVPLADGVILRAQTEQVHIIGFPSNRMMVGLKIKF